MSQMELLPKIKKVRNFYDRISLKYIINPLDEKETEEMINFRLKEAGLLPGREIFSPESVKLIFERSGGYPRRIAVLCHNALEELIIRQEEPVTADLISNIVGREDI